MHIVTQDFFFFVKLTEESVAIALSAENDKAKIEKTSLSKR